MTTIIGILVGLAIAAGVVWILFPTLVILGLKRFFDKNYPHN